ncbi:hypothetical protein [Streptomyces sp. NBC_01614]|uniref:hypothetical protein n=1 Tax=Streptomyces sp. NBC_01614 TaxID=2975897 RepID=UPI00386EE291
MSAPTDTDRTRITIACARDVLTAIQATPLGDPIATARMLGRAQSTIEALLALVEDKPA